jgi:hypothetical protein
MTTWSFTLVLSGIRELTSGVEDALHEAGCDDALPGIRNGVPFLDFDREAESFQEAVLDAVSDVARSVGGARVVRVEPDDLASVSEIARRLGRTRESVRLLWCGRRGPGGFPAPVAGLRGSSPLWSWAEVVAWIHRHRVDDGVDEAACRDALFIRRTNLALASGPAGTVDTGRRLRG